jgi:hypothetical protein
MPSTSAGSPVSSHLIGSPLLSCVEPGKTVCAARPPPPIRTSRIMPSGFSISVYFSTALFSVSASDVLKSQCEFRFDARPKIAPVRGRKYGAAMMVSRQSKSMSVKPLDAAPISTPMFCSAPLKYCGAVSSVIRSFFRAGIGPGEGRYERFRWYSYPCPHGKSTADQPIHL